MNRAAFLEGRRHFLGATDITAVIGVSPWASPLSVYLDKIGEGVPQDEILAMRRGNYMERFIRSEFVREHPEFTVDLHPAWPIRSDWGFPACASLDGLVRPRRKDNYIAVWQAKTTSAWNAREFDGQRGEMPDAYWTQVQWEMAVTDLERAYLAVDAGEPTELRILPVDRDQKVIERLIEAGHRFWTEHVEKRVPPQPNGSERDGAIIRSLYPRHTPGLAIVLDGKAEELVLAYRLNKAKADEAKAKAEECKQRLALMMGEAEEAVAGPWRITSRTQERKSYTVAAGSTRPLLIKEMKSA